MTTRVITQYICENCGKKYERRDACEKHERVCYKNPLNYAPCFGGCKHLDKERVELLNGNVKSLFFCLKKDCFLHPRQFEPYELDSGDENKPMPAQCDEFASISFSDEDFPF